MKIDPTPVKVLSCASGIGGIIAGCELAPLALKSSPYLAALPIPLVWANTHCVRAELRGQAALPYIADVCQSLAKDVYDSVLRNEPFLVVGGDQSCSIGTWSGAACALHESQGALGLIWIDAHMDSHTPETTPSGNIHGMSLAALMGYGEERLTRLFRNEIKVHPRNVCLIGVRSYESGEAELLTRLGVKIFFMEEVSARGIDTVLQEAYATVLQHASAVGIALDVDAITPEEAPGVGTPAAKGLHAAPLIKALASAASHYPLLGAEIVEFNPLRDVDHKTERVVVDLIQALFQGR